MQKLSRKNEAQIPASGRSQNAWGIAPNLRKSFYATAPLQYRRSRSDLTSPLAKQGQGNKQPPILRILWAVTHLRIPSFWDLTLRFFHIFTPQESCCILGAKDAENYLYKPFIDALALSLRITDSPFTFSYSAYNLASKNTNPGCYIKITKRAEKVGFLPNLRISFLRSNKCKPLKNTEISVSENTEITFQKSPQ